MSEPLDPAALRPHYARFLFDDRILLTGHSHQAWPDVAREGLLEAYEDASFLVDDKWGKAMEAADAVREAVAARLDAAPDEIALGQNTHELVTRFLSALDLRARPHVVTTTGEFHSLHRQLTRMAEAGLEVSWVDAAPVETLAERLAAAVRDDTAALMASTVLFETATVVPRLATAVDVAREAGAEVLLDTYHHVGVRPFELSAYGDECFVTGGGYKYLQWGEGTCFLRVPTHRAFRPIFTGWFSDFANLAQPRGDRIGYGPRPADVFAGSTYDPVSHYRARRVIRFFDVQGLTVERLRALYARQTQRIVDGLEGYRVRSPRDPDARGGFVAIEIENASAVVAALRKRAITTDARGRLLRLGPAPYVTDEEIDRALATLREVAPPT
ncbi:MAG TPA: aminotransferase class V-fold PLP-dependent enzyme [Sandaracinaceae bacterium LLY-WYZ-13_1]|nr:aminotransferase class V-fold PLP-dependent enzyme [Sandaracinaceae bacterium LLY-WYZ-13_1]